MECWICKDIGNVIMVFNMLTINVSQHGIVNMIIKFAVFAKQNIKFPFVITFFIRLKIFIVKFLSMIYTMV